jgi:hypothetical protein
VDGWLPIGRLRLAIALAATVLAASLPASAQAGNPNYRSVIERVTPDVPGVEFDVLEFDSYVELRDRSGHEVTIYGYEGEPYARILRDGTVQVNQRSPAAYLNTSFFPTAPVPAKANPKAPPEWKTQSHDGTFVWHDHRMHYLTAGVPPQVKDASRKTKIFDYEIPLRIDGRKGAIHGTLFWVGSPTASKLPIIVGSVVVLLGAAALLLVTRRRRRDDRGDGDGDDRRREPAAEAW